MQSSTGNNHIADTGYTTIVLRVVLNARGQIIHGELVDVASSRAKRFTNWNELIRVLSGRLKVESLRHRSDRLLSKSNQP